MVEKIEVYAYMAEDEHYHVNIPNAGTFKAKDIKEIDHISRRMIRAAGVADFFHLDIRMEYHEGAL